MALDPTGLIEQEVGNLGGEALGIGQFIKGLSDSKKAKNELDNLRQPFYKVQDAYYQNRNLSEERAGGGLGADTMNYLTTEGQRGLGSSISALNQGGGNPNDVANLFDSYSRSIQSTAAKDSQAHQQNIDYFMQANKDLAGQQNTAWTINEYQPYAAKLKELTERRAAAEQNEWGGLSTAVGSMIGAGTAKMNKSLIDKLYGNGDPYSNDPYAKGTGYAPRASSGQVANTGGTVPSPAGDLGGYLDPNRVGAGVQTSPIYPGYPITD
jgi:hypothetical protein